VSCDCGCCEGLGAETPATVLNPPGLPAVSYRVGSYGEFRASMLAALSSRVRPPLQDLATRDEDDFSIALLDAWAMVGDVLTFYEERFANENYLRTATERVSLLQLARLIGYELRPGVAANAALAFVLETAKEAPARVVVPAGTAVQSVPGPDELPQTFETSEELDARPEWNALRPRLLQPQKVSAAKTAAILQGLGLNLKAGDDLLVVFDTAANHRSLRTIVRAVEDADAKTTRVDFVAVPGGPPGFTPPTFPAATFLQSPTPLTKGLVQSLILQRTWVAADLVTQAAGQGWSVDDLTKSVRDQLAAQADTGLVGVYAFRTRAAVFGHNAPAWDSLPGNLRYGEQIKDASGNTVNVAAAYPAPGWDKPARTLDKDESKYRFVYLDNVYPKLVKGSWVALQSPSQSYAYRVSANAEVSRSDFTINAKVTRLSLDHDTGFKTFTMRETSVRGESQKLPLADLPIPNPIAGTRIGLDGFYPGLDKGRKVLLEGEPVDLPGVHVLEVVTLEQVTIEGGYTVLTLAQPLKHSYVRASVTINANVVGSTHGESTHEVLGSGDASQSYQRFRLRQPPLTSVSAATASGAESTLRVYVDGVRWHEVPTLFGRGPNERVYVTRLDDAGGTTVEFGDGVTGARVPTGPENIEARYRKGIGLVGDVRAGQLTLLLNRPLGVKTVSNQLPAEGAADAEHENEARRNAPLTVLTLDRVVSLDDFADFARAFAGIAKALATPIRDRSGDWVLLTVAGPHAAVVDPAGVLGDNLAKAIAAEGGARARFELRSFRPALFEVAAKLAVDPDHLPERVLPAADAALRSAFSFDNRSFGQPVARSEVEAVLQGVDGVVGVDLDKLARLDRLPGDPDLSPRLWASVPQSGDSPLLGAELLMLDARKVDLRVLA
jgi:predicted phage baseplate assembly protein